MEKSSQSGEATNKVRMIHTSYYLLVCFYRQLIPFSHFRFTSNHFPFCFHNISVEENKVILIPKRLFKSDWLLVTNNGRARSTLRLEQKTNMTNKGHQLLQESALLVWNSINFISWRMEKTTPVLTPKVFDWTEFSIDIWKLCLPWANLGDDLFLYADDIQLYSSFDPTNCTSINLALSTLALCISHIQSWMSDNMLKLNNEKTEFLLQLHPIKNTAYHLLDYKLALYQSSHPKLYVI